MKVAVLGGGSCFAMNLSWHLMERGDDVLSISRSPMRGPAFTYGLEKLKGFRYEQAHLVTDLDRIMRLLDDYRPDLIVNFAALCEVGLSWSHPLDYYETNLMSLVRLTNELATRSWFKKFVQIGSSEVYGSVESPAGEEAKVSPSSPYAVSKAAFDYHLRCVAKHQAFPAVIVMPSNGYCEGQTLNRIIPKAIICASRLIPAQLELQGGGVARKSYLHGDDISRAILLVAKEGKLGETYNVGPPESISIRALVSMIADKYGRKLEDIAKIVPERTGQDSQYLLDSTKIKALGWRQKISLDEGLFRMCAWVEREPSLLFESGIYRHRP
jgi:dTDP-glucose 4,6-dehydratase